MILLVFILIGNKRLMKCNDIFNKLLEDYGRYGCLDDVENFFFV